MAKDISEFLPKKAVDEINKTIHELSLKQEDKEKIGKLFRLVVESLSKSKPANARKLIPGNIHCYQDHWIWITDTVVVELFDSHPKMGSNDHSDFIGDQDFNLDPEGSCIPSLLFSSMDNEYTYMNEILKIVRDNPDEFKFLK